MSARITDVRQALEARFEGEPNGCWRWTGTMLASGYGVFTAGGVTRCAHRATYDAVAEFQRSKVTCPNGHAYTPDNTRVRTNGHRVCRTCHREREAARRRKAAA